MSYGDHRVLRSCRNCKEYEECIYRPEDDDFIFIGDYLKDKTRFFMQLEDLVGESCKYWELC